MKYKDKYILMVNIIINYNIGDYVNDRFDNSIMVFWKRNDEDNFMNKF